jgi:hypothetical protein
VIGKILHITTPNVLLFCTLYLGWCMCSKMGQELVGGKDLVAVCAEHFRLLLCATWGAG